MTTPTPPTTDQLANSAFSPPQPPSTNSLPPSAPLSSPSKLTKFWPLVLVGIIILVIGGSAIYQQFFSSLLQPTPPLQPTVEQPDLAESAVSEAELSVAIDELEPGTDINDLESVPLQLLQTMINELPAGFSEPQPASFSWQEPTFKTDAAGQLLSESQTLTGYQTTVVYVKKEGFSPQVKAGDFFEAQGLVANFLNWNGMDLVSYQNEQVACSIKDQVLDSQLAEQQTQVSCALRKPLTPEIDLTDPNAIIDDLKQVYASVPMTKFPDFHFDWNKEMQETWATLHLTGPTLQVSFAENKFLDLGIDDYFSLKNFKTDQNNLADGGVGSIIGFRKGQVICLVKTEFELESMDPLANGPSTLTVSCTILAEK